MRRTGLLVYIILFGFFLLLPQETEAKFNCGRLLKRITFVASKPFHPLIFRHTSLDAMGSQKFFRPNGKANFWALEDYILAHPPAVLDPSTQHQILSSIQTYRFSKNTRLKPFASSNAQKLYGKSNPELQDVLDFFLTRSDEIRKDLSSSAVYHVRRPIQTLLRYKLLILGTTIFVLWDPIQAEIRSHIYWAFNETRNLFQDSESSIERIDQIGELLSLVKSELRSLYFKTNDEYPTTMQMSRNNLNYLYDLILKRRSDLSVAVMVGDEQAIKWNMLYLYLIPYLYKDLYGSPLSGLLRDILSDTFERFDPEGRYRDEFEERIRSYFESRQIQEVQF